MPAQGMNEHLKRSEVPPVGNVEARRAVRGSTAPARNVHAEWRAILRPASSAQCIRRPEAAWRPNSPVASRDAPPVGDGRSRRQDGLADERLF